MRNLKGFNIKRFAHPYCLRVLLLGMRCYWFKCDAEAFRLWRADATRNFAAGSGRKIALNR